MTNELRHQLRRKKTNYAQQLVNKKKRTLSMSLKLMCEKRLRSKTFGNDEGKATAAIRIHNFLIFLIVLRNLYIQQLKTYH